MLRIESIELINFKSYRSCVINELSRDINVICGPNGAGKSGLLESICFVLGLRSSHLRASNLKKLIHNEFRDHSPCEVTVTFIVIENNCVSNRFSICRKVKPSGVSTYYFRKHGKHEGRKEIKLGDIQRKLKKYDLDLNFSDRYVFEQLRTVEISQKSDTELLQYIECIIGNDVLKYDIAKLESKHQELITEMNKINDSIANLKKSIDKLSNHVVAFEKWESLKKVHQEKIILLNQFKSNYYKKKLEEYEKVLNEYIEERSNLENEQLSINNEINDFDSELNENEVKKNQVDEELKELKKEINKLTGKKAKFDVYIADYNQDKFDIQMESFENDILALKSKIQECHDKINSLDYKGKDYKKNDLLKFEKQLKGSIKEVFCEFKNIYEEWNRISLKLIDNNGLKDIQNKIDLQNEIINEHKQYIFEKELKREEYRNEWEKLCKTIESCNEQIENNRKENLADDKKISEIEKEISIASPKNTMYEANSLIKYAKAIQTLRKIDSNSHDIFGFLFEIACLKDAKYKQAVNTAIGISSLTTSIVVRTRKAANAVIDYFDKHSIGMVVCHITEELNQKTFHKGSLNNVLNLSSCVDVKYSECQCIFDKLLGQWYVCDTKEEASSLSFDKKNKIRRNVITINGEMFSKSGEVSSGPKHKSWEKYFGFDVKIGSIQSFSHDNPIHSEEKSKKIEKLTQLLNSYQQTIHDRNISIAKNTEKLKSYQQHSNQLQEDIANIDIELKERQSMISKCYDLIRLYNEQIDSFNHQMEMENKKRVKKEELFKQMNEYMERYEDLKQYYQLIERHREAKELKKLHNDQYVTLSKEIKTYERKIKSIQKRKETLLSQKNDYEVNKKELNKIELKLEELFGEEKLLKKNKSDILNVISSINNKIKKLKQNERKVKTKLESLHNEIEKHELMILKVQKKFHHFHSEDHMEVEMTMKSLKKEIKQLEFELLKFEEEIKEKEKSIDMKAVEMYREHTKELERLSEQENSLKSSISSILKNIKILEDKRYNNLVNSMESINKALSEIYADLSIHGDCYLAYPKEMDALFELGISFNVKPDRHQWKTMNELSGGQKAMASLALALSINRIYPSPLLLFDEVDASLDTDAVERLVDVIYRMSKEYEKFPQFFIITHRPEFYEKARSLISVYRYKKSSQMIQWSTNSESLIKR